LNNTSALKEGKENEKTNNNPNRSFPD